MDHSHDRLRYKKGQFLTPDLGGTEYQDIVPSS